MGCRKNKVKIIMVNNPPPNPTKEAKKPVPNPVRITTTGRNSREGVFMSLKLKSIKRAIIYKAVIKNISRYEPRTKGATVEPQKAPIITDIAKGKIKLHFISTFFL